MFVPGVELDRSIDN